MLKKTVMKTISTIAVILLFAVRANAQTASVQPILDQYLTVKDALVKSDPVRTSAYAAQLVKTINSTSDTGLQPNERKELADGRAKLLKAAEKISKATDLVKQRTAFAELSLTMWKLVKNAESIKVPVYYQYCPMKKSYWLSTEAAIKNPYYGADMLTCGNVAAQK